MICHRRSNSDACETRPVPWPLPGCPALDHQDDRGPRHKEHRERHGDGEDEHGVQVAMFHRGDAIFIAHHEDQAASDKAKRSDNLRNRP